MADEDYYYQEEDYEINYEPDDLDLEPQQSYNIVKNEDLNTLREKIISEFIDKTYMERDDSIIALINYQWNLDKINDDWYNDVDGNRKKFGIDLDEKNQKDLKNEGVETNTDYCLICFCEFESGDIDQQNSNNLESFSLKCKHNFCLDCFNGYIIDKLDDYFGCLNATCPQGGCSLKIPESIFLKCLGNDINLRNKYERNVLRNFTEKNVDIKWCPKENCGRCVRTDKHYNTEILCDCGFVYCFNCLREGHK